MSDTPRSRAAWLWIPSLYFAESIPNSVVAETASFMYNDFKLSPQDLGVVTGWMYLPWVIKSFWSPMVDLINSKRWWILFTEILLAGCFLGLAWGVTTPDWLFWTKIFLWTMAFASATQDISADGFYMLGLNETQQAAYNGVRTTAYKLGPLFAKGFMVWGAGRLAHTMGVAGGWSTILAVPAVIFLVLALYHFFMLPRPVTDLARPMAAQAFLSGYAESFRTFFAKPRILPALAFMLLFRLAEAQVLPMVGPFLTGKLEAGGLGITTEEVGIAYGTFGVCGIICGGILGGLLVARFGLFKTYWKFIFIMHLPNLAFLLLAYTQTQNLAIISACLFIEQFGYGFGFTAYTLYLLYFARGELQTSHYAIATGFMAISSMAPRMVSGYALHALGFQHFYLYIAVCTLPSFLVAWLAWKDKEFLAYFEPKK